MKKIILAASVLMIFSVYGFAQEAQTMTVKLYFLNEKLDPNLQDCRKVRAVTRVIPKTLGVARASLDELFKGVTAEEKAKGFVSFSPEETRGILKSIKVKNGAAYINFNKVVYEQLGSATSSCGGGFFASIENTLMQFPTIKKVFYAIEGSPKDFYEWVQVGECPKELNNCSGADF
jgi:spore germination protein GerM